MSHRRTGRRLRSLAATALIPLLLGTWTIAQEPAKTATPTAEPAKPAAPVQEPAKAEGPATDAARNVGDLTAKYRFQERFSVKTSTLPYSLIGQYQVAFRETFTALDVVEKDNRVRTVQAIFSERPVAVNPADERVVTDSLRHYSRITMNPDPWKGRADRRPLEDLTIWYRQLHGETPLVMVLTPGRSLRDEEYRFAINYAFAQELAFVLPDTPVRIGEKWTVNRTGATALLNDEVRDGNLSGKLIEIRAHPVEPKLQVAIIQVSGRVVTGISRDIIDTAVNARVEFVFLPGARENATIDGGGAIEKVVLAQSGELRIPGQTQTRTRKRDLIFEMKRPGADSALTLPNPLPKPTPENSWLTFNDPKNRFHIRHPQGFEPRYDPKTNRVTLLHLRTEGGGDDAIEIEYVEKPEARPEVLFERLVAAWQRQGWSVQRGQSGNLPETEWGDVAVAHMEAAIDGGDEQGRTFHRIFDAFFLQFPRNISLQVSATTFQEQPEAFRAQVQAMLKTAKLGPPKKE